MLIKTYDQNKYISANLKKVDFFIEANKLALQVINCITHEPTSTDMLNCIYNKTGIQISKHTLDIIRKSNDARISFINLCKKQILDKIYEIYNNKPEQYIMLITPDLRV